MLIDSQIDRNEIGRSLGHDLYRYGRPLEADRLGAPVAEGFVQARARHVDRSTADRFVRKWLQLRVNAYRRDRIVDAQVTPRFLALIDVAECPVLRIALTHGRRAPSDWSIDRLNNDGAYARSNLAVMSTLANRAKGSKSFDEVLRLSQAEAPTDGLSPDEWLRMAALMLGPSFASNPSFAPLVPLVAPIPSYTVRPTFQIVQNLFTQQARLQSGRNALVRQLGRAVREPRSQRLLERFADLIHRGLKTATPCWDVWRQPAVMAAFCDWRRSIAPAPWGLVGQIAAQLTAARPVASDRLKVWHLSSHGHFH